MIYDRNLIEEMLLQKEGAQATEDDLVISIFGKEGTGKSIFGLNLLKLLDPTFIPENVHTRVAQTYEDFANKAPELKAYEGLQWDEAHRFSKRGTYDTEVNRVLLEYFQDSRGLMRIYILCYPELREVDRKVIQRSDFYFETIKKNTFSIVEGKLKPTPEYWVRGWSEEQIDRIIRSFRVYSYDSKQKLWIGVPKAPKRVFQHDFKGIEEIKIAYRAMKAGSLRLTDEKLRMYGARDPIHVANEIERITTLGYERAKQLAYKNVKRAIEEGWSQEDEIIKVHGRYKIKNNILFEKIVDACLEFVDPDKIKPKYKRLHTLPQITTIPIITEVTNALKIPA